MVSGFLGPAINEAGTQESPKVWMEVLVGIGPTPGILGRIGD